MIYVFCILFFALMYALKGGSGKESDWTLTEPIIGGCVIGIGIAASHGGL